MLNSCTCLVFQMNCVLLHLVLSVCLHVSCRGAVCVWEGGGGCHIKEEDLHGSTGRLP